MAYFDNSTFSETKTLRQRLAALFDTPLERRTRRKAAQVAALRALSDEDLAARGISRDDILRLVFASRRF